MKFTKKGFTLIELLIVIAIIGILAVAFLPSLLDAPSRGRDAQRLATVQKIQNFLVTELLAGNDLPVSGCLAEANPADDTIADVIADNLADFGGVYPTDPSATNVATGAEGGCDGYGFVNFDDGIPYTGGLFVRVENEENGNIICEDIAADTEPALLATVTEDPDNAAFPCYLSLIH